YSVADQRGESAVVHGCAAGEPLDLSPMVTAEPPMPANATINPKIEAPGGGEDDCGDPTVSLKPQGTAIPPGSTMDKIRKRKKLVVGVDQNTFLFGFRNPTTGQLGASATTSPRRMRGRR